MPAGLLALAIGGFGIGLTEFVILGLLPEVASDLAVSEATAGWLISGDSTHGRRRCCRPHGRRRALEPQACAHRADGPVHRRQPDLGDRPRLPVAPDKRGRAIAMMFASPTR
jgi:hypothetical protein